MKMTNQNRNDAIKDAESVEKDILKKPYTRMVVPDDDGTFRAEVLEFPGCIATGDTNVEALCTLENVAGSWIASATAQRQTIPEPINSHDYSGRMVVRFPRSLHKKAALMAALDGVSLNQLIVASLAEYLGGRSASKNQHVNLFFLPTLSQGMIVGGATNSTFVGYQNTANTTTSGKLNSSFKPQMSSKVLAE